MCGEGSSRYVPVSDSIDFIRQVIREEMSDNAPFNCDGRSSSMGDQGSETISDLRNYGAGDKTKVTLEVKSMMVGTTVPDSMMIGRDEWYSDEYFSNEDAT